MGSMLDLKRLFRALGYACAGTRDAVLHHTAFRQELLIVGILISLALWLGKNGVQQAILIGVLVFVLIVELLNSAIERVVDRIGKEENTLSKQAKDLGAAAVFLSILTAVVVWCLVLLR